MIHSPKPSLWPVILAATLTLSVAGLVVHPIVALVGIALSLFALIAWVLERFEDPSVAVEPRIPSLGNGQTSAVMRVEAGRRPGWWGLVWFISSEALFFANMIVAYLYLRVGSHSGTGASPHLELLFPSFNTVILLLSGVPAFYAQRAIKRGDIRGLRIGLVLAALLGAVFLAGQGYEYMTVGITLQSSIRAAGFFILTGFHGAHVAAGVGLLLFVFALSLRGRVNVHHDFTVEVASTYWHFVDLVWIFLFAILYVFQ